MKKKAKEASTASSDAETDSSGVDDMLRRLLEQETIEPVYAEEEQQVLSQPSEKKKIHEPGLSSEDSVKSSGSLSGSQNKHRAKVSISSREELRKAILYSEIIRRKY